jgi:signal transduction histidine kinase
MFKAPSQHEEYAASRRDWTNGTALPRRVSVRLGLQAKIIFCFITLVTAALAASSWTFAKLNHDRLTDVMSEQTRQIATALALSSEQAVRDGRWDQLNTLGGELVKSRNIVFVSFLDASAKPMALSSREAGFQLEDLSIVQHDTRLLMQVRPMKSAVLGEYIEMIAPIVAVSPAADANNENADAQPATFSGDDGRKLVGYVAVGLSQSREQAQLRAINYAVGAIGGIAILISLPLASLLVYRIFLPIRQLVAAAKKITAGDLEIRVAIHRPDSIGELARSFNEMVQWVKKQRQDLAAANGKLFEANRDLEIKIEQRTLQLETANGRLSSEIAEKEDFLRAISHDLNAPLRNIAGMATMLLMKHKSGFDEDVIHRLERIKKNVDVETDLIAELLELSRIKTRRQKMELLNLEALIWEMRGLFENDLKSRSIDLIVDSPLPALNAERARIRQVFQNLIDNAIKYMGDGERREIHIGSAVRMTEVEFYVRDTGMGIEPEDVEKVFFVFRRGKNSAAMNIAGKGVGLASVKSIVETYNGKIWVESKMGEGTTFRFTINGKNLPLGAGDGETGNVVSSDAQPKQGGSQLPAAA